MYQVTNLKQAVYEMSDVLNYFYQCVNQAVRNTVSETEMVDLNGRDRELGVRIAAYVNRMTAKTAEHGELGIACQSFIVQSVKVDEKILEANQKIFAAKRQQGEL
jgi:regulator of protease activity HflC (stomatin/prohibitin superfamily)